MGDPHNATLCDPGLEWNVVAATRRRVPQEVSTPAGPAPARPDGLPIRPRHLRL